MNTSHHKRAQTVIILFSLFQANEAFKFVMQRKSTGKVVINTRQTLHKECSSSIYVCLDKNGVCIYCGSILSLVKFYFPLFQTHHTLPYAKTRRKKVKPRIPIKLNHNICVRHINLGYVHIASVKFSTILKICVFQLCRCSVYMEPPSSYKDLGTKLFKVLCEQTKKWNGFM